MGRRMARRQELRLSAAACLRHGGVGAAQRRGEARVDAPRDVAGGRSRFRNRRSIVAIPKAGDELRLYRSDKVRFSLA